MAASSALVRLRTRQGVLELREGGPGLQVVYVKDSSGHPDLVVLDTSQGLDVALPLMTVAVASVDALVTANALTTGLS